MDARSQTYSAAQPRNDRHTGRTAVCGSAQTELGVSVATGAAVVEIDGRRLSLEAIRAVAEEGAEIRIESGARGRVAAARRLVEEKFAQGEAIYGVTTGFGRLANVSIAPADAEQLQLNLVRSHAAGTGEP